jgi:hypothetical protein
MIPLNQNELFFLLLFCFNFLLPCEPAEGVSHRRDFLFWILFGLFCSFDRSVTSSPVGETRKINQSTVYTKRKTKERKKNLKQWWDIFLEP